MTAFPFDTGTGKPTDAAAANENASATEIAATKGFWRDTKGLLERVVYYLRSIAMPPWLDVATYALRMTFPSSATLPTVTTVTGVTTVTTVTTVSTVSDQTNIGGLSAKTALADQMALINWNQTVRARLT